MSEKGEEDVKGTLICGADGAVYFISDQDLEAFRVPDDDAHTVRDTIQQPSEAAGIVGTKLGESGIIIVGGVAGRRPVGAMGPTAVPGIIARPS